MADAISFRVPIALPGDPTSALHATPKQYVDDGLSAKAPLVSPTFTGTPLVPTAPVGTNTAQVASTAFVIAEIEDRASGGGGSGLQLYIQDDAPASVLAFAWFQTGLGTDGNDYTLWFNVPD